MASNLLKRFPNTKEEAMKEKFPLVKWNEVTRYVRTLFKSLILLPYLPRIIPLAGTTAPWVTIAISTSTSETWSGSRGTGTEVRARGNIPKFSQSL